MNSDKPTETLDTNVLVEFWNDWGKESITKALLDLRDGGPRIEPPSWATRAL